MSETLEAQVRRLTAGSEFLASVASVRADGGVAHAVGDTPLRALHKPEVAQLEALGNTADDWARVRVADGFNPRRVRNCEFRGDVVLGWFKQRVQLVDGVEVVAGLSNSTLVDCAIGHDAAVKDVRLLANYAVGPGAVVVDCGRLVCAAGATFGNGARVPVALEGGGREVDVFAELEVDLAAVVASPGSRRPELESYRRAVADYRTRATADRGVIGAGARVWSVPRLEDTFVGPAARIDGAAYVARCTLLSTDEESVVIETGAVVTDSLLQWGSRVTGAAVVEGSVLGEQVRVDRHGKVRNSVLGPNTEVAAGEVSSCLLGPFVNCPHQSLLISTYWPAGRGNVGYGANVGSNHTSRAPDQEFRAAEGLFLGLGVNVKFPCNLGRAPYTVVACGTNLPPQKVAFPFSLIAPPLEPFPDVPPGFNQISPGWVLRENVYALKRNEAKFRARNRARRSRFDFAVLRRETVEPMRAACRALAQVYPVKLFYTAQDISGLGKNVMTDRDRVRAVSAYEFYTRYYALLGLRGRVRDTLAAGRDAAGLLTTAGEPDGEWEYQRQILVEECGLRSVADGLSMLADMALEVAKDCERARGKDDTRGVRIIDDYADVHPAADRDRVVRQAWEDADHIREEVSRFLSRLSGDTEVHSLPVAADKTPTGLNSSLAQ
jgi:hypothetical protein